MRLTLRRFAFLAVMSSLMFGLLRLWRFGQSRGQVRVTELLQFTDEKFELTETFKAELELKKKLMRQYGSKDEGAGPLAVPVEAPDGQQPRDLDADKSHLDGIDPRSYFRGENSPDDMLSLTPPDYLTNYRNPCWYESGQTEPSNKTVRCLPYLHLIGVDKSGTTDLWARMSRHPDFVRPDGVLNKETHWWSWRRFGFDIWVKGKKIRHFDWYLHNFDRPAKVIERKVVYREDEEFHPMITGDGSPTVFWDFTGWNLMPQNYNRTAETAWLTPDCIKHLTPNAKFIVMLRNPTPRLYSDYLFLDKFRSWHNVSVKGFHQEVLRSLDMLTQCFSQKSKLECLYDKELHMRIPVRLMVGMYDVFLQKWHEVFPREQILVLRNEDYSKNIQQHLKEIFNFLELDPLPDSELDRLAALPRALENSNGARKWGPMMEETRKILDGFYSVYNRQLAERLADSKFLWEE